MVNRLVVRNLMHRPIRTALSVLAVAVEVAMILLIVGLSEGLLEESQRRTRGIGADIMIRPSSSSAAMSLSSADIPEQLSDVLKERFPEVALAMGTAVHAQGDLQTVTGVEWDRFVEMTGGIHYFAGGPLEGPYDAIVDEVYARYQNAAPGDTLELLNRKFRITGVVEAGKMSRIFIPLATMQDLMGWDGKVSQVFVKTRDPSQVRPLIEKIQELLPGYPVYAVEDFLSLAAADVRSMASQFVNVIIGIAVLIGFIVVLLSMYTAVLERTREIGILKSLGASKVFITTMVLRESALVAVAGILVGTAIGYLSEWVIEARFPLISVIMIPDWLAWGALIAILGSMFGALYPATRAARQDPIEAISYE